MKTSFVFNILLNTVFKHSFHIQIVENVENYVYNHVCALRFQLLIPENLFYSFPDE